MEEVEMTEVVSSGEKLKENICGPCPLCGATNGKITRSRIKEFKQSSIMDLMESKRYSGFAAMRARVNKRK